MQLIVGISGCLEKCVEVIIFSMIFKVIIYQADWYDLCSNNRRCKFKCIWFDNRNKWGKNINKVCELIKCLQNWNFKENAFDRLEMAYDEIFNNSGNVSLNSIDKTDHCFIGTFLLVMMCLLLLITFAVYYYHY